MKAIANFIIAISDYMRVEGRALRHNILFTATLLVLLLCAAVMVFGGLVALLLGLYTSLRLVTPQPAALTITGVTAILIGGGCLWRIVHQTK